MSYGTSFILGCALLWVLMKIMEATKINPLGIFLFIFFVLVPIGWLLVTFK